MDGERTKQESPAPTASRKAELDRAFEELYRAHLRDVYSYAYYRVGNHHDAEDLTEQAFLQAYRHFERARRESNGRPLRPWLIRIAHNLASNYHRDRARRPTATLEAVEPPSHPHDTEQIVEGREELRLVMDRLDRLSDDRREALIMRFALGMSNREIARALGRTDGATKVLIHRAIKQLEEEMENGVSEGERREPEPDLERCSRRPAPDRAAGATSRAGSRRTLSAITEQAAAELSSWAEELSESELDSLRDPRNWVRPVAAVAAGTLAGGALVVVGMRRRRRSTGFRATAESVLRSVRPEQGAPRCDLRRSRSASALAGRTGRAGGEPDDADDQVQDVVLAVDRARCRGSRRRRR